MELEKSNDWRSLCEQHSLDPDEVRIVAERFDMYTSYTESTAGSALPLERWYKWYRIEKLSEGHAATGAPPAGCSVSADASGRVEVLGEPEFLRLLQLYRESVPDR